MIPKPAGAAPDMRPELSAVKRAIVEIRELRATIEAVEHAASEPIAIVGLGCRFPGADGPDAYWRLLHEGTDAIGLVPPDRWDAEALYDPDPSAEGKSYTRHGGFLDRVDTFDAAFFGISPREAVSLDPQQRLLLEVVWEALEHAGIPPDSLKGMRGGVFLGLTAAEYGTLFLTREMTDISAYVGTGNALSVAAGRLSYVFGLQGPCLAIDTACSSSLVAVHLACQSLRSDECRIAVAGGASLMLRPEATVNFCRARMLAPDGRCKTFDAAADGYSRGEGVGIVLLKRLSHAIEDGNRVLGLVLGSTVNQDGRTAGLTVPNGPSQEALIREALTKARVQPCDVGYIEAHGTGTSLGDPIEMHSLRQVFGGEREAERPLVVGSVKTNFGHLEAAAGVAGLIKVVLALQHSEIPPHLHLERLNPHMDFSGFAAVIPTAPRPWPGGRARRIAGVSAFGFSGTNAHVVVAESPAEAEPARDAGQGPQVILLSARTPSALAALAKRVADHVRRSDVAIADLAYTAAAGRAHLATRLAFVASDRRALCDALDGFAAGEQQPEVATRQLDTLDGSPVVFLFQPLVTGIAEMARELSSGSAVFREAFSTAMALLRTQIPQGVAAVAVEEVVGLNGEPEADSFAVLYAAAQMWRSWGLEPAAVGGSGVGEYVAACVAGVFTLEAACALAGGRVRSTHRSNAGVEERNSFARIAQQISEAVPHTRLVLNGPGDGTSAAPGAAYWARELSSDSAGGGVAQALADHGVVLDVSAVRGSGADRHDHVSRGVGEVLTHLYVQGVSINWEAVFAHHPGRRVSLPTYPFERERYWIDLAPEAPITAADPVPFSVLVQRAQRQADHAPLDLQLQSVGSRAAAVDELTTAFVVCGFDQLGIFKTLESPLSADDVVERHQILPIYRKVVRRWMARLVAAGVLSGSADLATASAPIAVPRLEEIADRARLLLGADPSLLHFVTTGGGNVAAVLTGRHSPIDSLFPRGSFEIAEGLYDRSPEVRYFNAIAGAVVGALSTAPPGGTLQVLEIGGGVGGTTSMILPMLIPDRCTYQFTDLSAVFLARAATRFAAYPFVRYGVLDIEQDPAPQGIPTRAWDVIVATNVLHATIDLRDTLRRTRELLAPGGVLILIELTEHPAWFDLGLIDGWQRYDDDVRTDSPVLPSDRWREVLRESGFSDVAVLPEPGSPAEVLGQHVFLAREAAGPDAASRVVVSMARAAGTQVPAEDFDASDDLRRSLQDALPEEQHELLVGYVRTQVARVLRLGDAPAIDRRHRLMDLGLDSLMAVELRGLLERGLRVTTLPATLVFDYPTIEEVATYLMRGQLDLADAPQQEDEGGVPPADTVAADAAARVADLSDDAVEALLIESLKQL